ncbi:Dabb family protein [uncultured Winogradskyella sp.]|uniref:Dabb family protein n=1 Tax=uncultured Winogradskyella sp. TaxID=395353 RepID=UPI0026271531|nr:Dabb family protein [uncultured Winogradskyella sp.]
MILNRFRLKTTIIIFTLGLCLTSCIDEQKKEKESNEKTTLDGMEIIAKKLRHVVLFKFKESATKDDIKKIETAFIELPDKIKEIEDFEWGLNNSPEGLDKGFTHCFFVTFNSEEARSKYLPHPDHKAFVDILGPHLEDVLVIDYWAK